ncbi:hypothetical protein F4824DRAFT_505409 [Ustulina deusta]|nr:hypothetical protein F4824DRAFT_505409 [Ustulina deusta]
MHREPLLSRTTPRPPTRTTSEAIYTTNTLFLTLFSVYSLFSSVSDLNNVFCIRILAFRNVHISGFVRVIDAWLELLQNSHVRQYLWSIKLILMTDCKSPILQTILFDGSVKCLGVRDRRPQPTLVFLASMLYRYCCYVLGLKRA